MELDTLIVYIRIREGDSLLLINVIFPAFLTQKHLFSPKFTVLLQ